LLLVHGHTSKDGFLMDLELSQEELVILDMSMLGLGLRIDL
jgi:hypothetical protein